MKAAPLIGISRHRLSTDGEGVTTLVAFHGCPLRCKYCLNPQSLHSEGIWKNYDCEQLYEEVRQDELYFLATHGGITFGGGEPCLQSDFIDEFRQLCGQEWQLSVETTKKEVWERSCVDSHTSYFSCMAAMKLSIICSRWRYWLGANVEIFCWSNEVSASRILPRSK